MKLMKKILVSAMAISAIAAVGAVSTYAEAVTISPADSAFTVNYDATAGTITLSNVTVANDQKTLLVLNADVDTFDDTTAKAEAEGGAIAQIDQSTTFESVAIPVGVRAEGSTLVVRVGGDETFQEVVCTIPSAGGDTVTVGDVNGDGDITSGDAAEILCATVNLESVIDSVNKNDAYYAAAYCNGDAEITSGDAAEVLCATVNLEHHENIGEDIVKGSVQ